jgi:hypothetical protein
MPRPLRPAVALAASALLGAFLCGCGDDSNPTKPASPTSASGNVNKAPIVGASVNIHTINSNGSIGALVAGPFTTDANGDWTGTIPGGASGPFVMVSTGGSYVDEATGNPVTLGSRQSLYGIYQTGSCAVTPLTHATFLGMRAMVSGGTALATAITAATSSSTTAFGFSFTTTTPSEAAGATTSQKRYAALLGGLSTLLDANPELSGFTNTPPGDLVIALSKDMADGQFDGQEFGAAIMVPTDATGTTTAEFPGLSLMVLTPWLTAANTYAASQTNLAGISFNVLTLWNPSKLRGGGGGRGTVTFSGTGLGSLGGNTACTPDTSYLTADPLLVWNDQVHGIDITAIPADQNAYPGKIETVSVTSWTSTEVDWSMFTPSGVAGISMVGGKTTFTNTVLTEVTAGGTSLTLNGTLTNPVPP